MAVGPKCQVAVTVDVTGGKWKPMISYRLLDGPRRFGELRRLVGVPSQRSLTMRLRELEANGIVSREVFAKVPPRVEYSLTEFGKTLAPVLMAMRDWGVSFQIAVKPRRHNRLSSSGTRLRRETLHEEFCQHPDLRGHV